MFAGDRLYSRQARSATFSVTAIFCLSMSCRIAPTVPLPFGARRGLIAIRKIGDLIGTSSEHRLKCLSKADRNPKNRRISFGPHPSIVSSRD